MTLTNYETSTVFLVDDDDRIRASLARALDKRGFQVESYPSAETFLDAFDPKRPGCLVLDYGMPGLNGLDLQKHLAGMNAFVPIIFISGQGGVPESVQAMKAGAVDFLEKPFRQSELLACIQTAFENDLAARNAEEVTKTARKRFDLLTAREKEVAIFIIKHPSTTSSKEVGRQLEISPRTVDHHRARILEKMAIGSIAELIDLSGSAALLSGDP
ncbi:response regulator transcription factor [Sulfitobacter donghicola]|uniref:LuxR family transcriptional regulator n=1 Tax=Sulfitobacter donghicola DSW-25 = KCTC 12864 = JCM 14565 TaxID=1300350 RepID=A0A073IU99_9RHOB|nr:response regulator [Sulfitobacter donghicola]KEJ88967.1 LuxR family transcriptional regulator [Sulfitobacter donghicola DSW-25 = KCTC 12864 = JCM 14565]KIN67483.1 Transcriptional regulatory protein FixJ [Sulfitobacter donghicola DSW-25 = KCTC 12864 = JCM 14565]